MTVLCTPDYGDGIQRLVQAATTEVAVVSAFATCSGIEKVFRCLSPSLRRKELHVRWQADDLIAGASDLAVFELAKEYGVALFMQPSLHAKFVVADRRKVILGSANVTGRGLGITSYPNTEVGMICEPPAEELKKLEALLERSVLVTPDLFDRLRNYVDRNRLPPRRNPEFTDDIDTALRDRFTGLWVRDLPFHPDPPSKRGTAASDTDIELESTFIDSKCLRWLRGLLSEPDFAIYFGELTSSLHDSLLEDPTPYRTEVKKLVGNLMNWCVSLLPAEFGIDVPNHSQRLFQRQNIALSRLGK